MDETYWLCVEFKSSSLNPIELIGDAENSHIQNDAVENSDEGK